MYEYMRGSGVEWAVSGGVWYNRRMKRWVQISGILLSIGIFGSMAYFWFQEEYAVTGYIAAGIFFVSYGGRIIYALVYEKKTGRTPVDE
ncbi:MAG: hypothetical protein KC897_04515 [Candidatus Omnitrophica bacterium]|nr:hypothetical protein [Candidatus Omnitrophota bacterium]MCB9719423.1 hypothetical protein [Candidatus Omnitrophota bacterium]